MYPVTAAYSSGLVYWRRYFRISSVFFDFAIALPPTTIWPRCRAYSDSS